MKRKTVKRAEAALWPKTVIILARSVLWTLASTLALISIHGLGRI